VPIDGCIASFAELTVDALPKYMKEMRAAMKRPRPLADFCKKGLGVKSIACELGRERDFSGCYVLIRDAEPFYVGISRGVIGRLRQHGTGKTHFDASLAYRMACQRVTHELTRDQAMKDSTFLKAFEEARELLVGCDVASIEITNPLELYLFEAYCAMELDTHRWNTFRTH